MTKAEWQGFNGGLWQEEINVRDFVQRNYTPYDGAEDFLAAPTEATNRLWQKLQELQRAERRKGGVLDMDTDIVSGLTSHGAGYIDESLKDLERIVGLQTDKPLKRAFMPYGGIKMAEESCRNYGYEPSERLHEIFTKYHKTHNQAVFDAYTPEIRRARHSHIITGLPDTYGRGRIVGDYRRVALYGIDRLIEAKKADHAEIGSDGVMSDDVIRLREEVAEQIRALGGMKEMAAIYGFDISRPARTAQEAVQWLYFGYLAAIKTQNGAAMSVGRISTFLDIYIERDMKEGRLTEAEAQELIDHLVMKFRMVKFARITSYNELFSGDPVWATLEVAGIGMDGRSMVTKNDFRFLHTLENMGPAPEPNLTVLYSEALPESFKRYAAKISIDTSSIQYENDDVMKPAWGDDYSICCCVSATQTGKEMQFFGARANLAKCLLSAIKYARVRPVYSERGYVVDYEVEGDFPRYGNDDDRADDIARWLLKTFIEKVRARHTYRNSEPTTSILTITSNVVYGKYTGAMPDGRKAWTPLAPGANPSYGAEKSGLLASLNSVTKLPYEWALDGISNTQSMTPESLGHTEEERIDQLVRVLDGYFTQGAHHLNVNVFDRAKLLDAVDHPEKEEYQNFTIRVSGYAVKFISLTREQQMDVIARTFHEAM